MSTAYVLMGARAGNKTRAALRVCDLFQFEHLLVERNTLSLRRPIFTDAPFNHRVSTPEYSEMILVCKLLVRAFPSASSLVLFCPPSFPCLGSFPCQ